MELFNKLQNIISGETGIENTSSRHLRKWLEARWGKLEPELLIAERVRSVEILRDYENSYDLAKAKAVLREERAIKAGKVVKGWTYSTEADGFLDPDLHAWQKSWRNKSVELFGCETDLQGRAISVPLEVKERLRLLDPALEVAYLHHGEPSELSELRATYWAGTVAERSAFRSRRLVIEKELSIDPADPEAHGLVATLLAEEQSAHNKAREALDKMRDVYGVAPSANPVWGLKRGRQECLAIRVKLHDQEVARRKLEDEDRDRNAYKQDTSLTVDEAMVQGTQQMIDNVEEAGNSKPPWR